MKLTNLFYLKRIAKSNSPFEMIENVMKYWGFVQARLIQSSKFNDPFLAVKF